MTAPPYLCAARAGTEGRPARRTNSRAAPATSRPAREPAPILPRARAAAAMAAGSARSERRWRRSARNRGPRRAVTRSRAVDAGRRRSPGRRQRGSPAQGRARCERESLGSTPRCLLLRPRDARSRSSGRARLRWPASRSRCRARSRASIWQGRRGPRQGWRSGPQAFGPQRLCRPVSPARRRPAGSRSPAHSTSCPRQGRPRSRRPRTSRPMAAARRRRSAGGPPRPPPWSAHRA